MPFSLEKRIYLIMFEIVHLHIPKTGGSSLLDLYRKNYGSNAVVSVKRASVKGKTKEELINFFSAMERPQLKVLHGHFYWSEVGAYAKNSERLKIVAFFRDPVERVISNFFFFKKRIKEGKVTSTNLNRMDETLLEYAALDESKNRMSKFMAGLEPENLFFAGLMENFESDVEELFSKLGCNITQVSKTNTNPHFLKERESISESERGKIADYNKQDIELYERILLLKNQKKGESL